ncbi:hydroxyproline-2-epimerase [Celeribacter ethanolicus]|uniref:Hydroxyproline-2-epimerase n=1 Tax=Celeribacter ethanolicus TaxID=1758178 RepID=A0A291G7V5_9RHOB|nr:4-hydroxyproline epimerase [Celeribacter ethanolicus]ATG46164.1 hydroxyproline-2-epimerase [Celeribacter ethanolicus]
MSNHTFTCIDGHTCGNPVRLVAGGGPRLEGANMIEKRAHFLRDFDWIRTGLMFEPRGHDMMSGSILYPPTREDCDVAVLFIETSGCLPMCGHGTIGTVTMAIENGLVTPKEPGKLMLDTPAGPVSIDYRQEGRFIEEVRLTNVPAFLYAEGLIAEIDALGEVTVDVSYGGNFYAIVEPQACFNDMADFTAGELIEMSRALRRALNEKYDFVHPEKPEINGLSHIMWTGKPTIEGATARNAVFYGDKAIDRSPCGTGTSARMAQWAAKGRLNVGDEFIHESIIGSLFKGRVEAAVKVGAKDKERDAIIPSIGGWARQTGFNTIFIDDRDPYAHGFTVV